MHSHAYRSPEQLAGRRVLVVGGGNSAMDIAVDASYAAERTLLSLRRGVWVVPKHLLGRPSDTLNGALARRLPWRLRQRISQGMITAAVGSPTRYGLPAPAHGFLQDHPTLSDGPAVPTVARGDPPRPGVAALDGDRVTFTDGRTDEVDLIIWCTGYRVEIPFLDPALLGDGADALPLYRHVFHPDVPGLTFVGLVQSTGGVPPAGGAGPTGRRTPRRPVRAARPGPGSTPTSGPSGGRPPSGGGSGGPPCGSTSTATCASSAGS